MAEAAVDDRGARRRRGGCGATGRGGCSTSCSRCSSRCCSSSPALLVLLDSAPGHRFIVDRLAQFETASGLRIRIGRIDGSIFGKSQLRNVTRRRPARRLPDLAQHQARLGARRLALQQALRSTA